MITAAVPTLLALSIFWHELLARNSLRRYLLIFWLIASMPLAFVCFAQSYWHLLACHLASAVGVAGASPLFGELLKRFYPGHIRGRVYGVLNVAGMIGAAGVCYGVGRWMNADAEAFRIYMPLGSLLQLGSIAVYVWLDRATPRTRRSAARSVPAGHRLSALLRPVFHMGKILRGDRTFLRYEAAFMTYGVGWMICHALVPVLADKRLNMTYEQYADTTQVAQQTAMVLMILPMGWVLDRFGAARTCCVSFAALAIFPLLLTVSVQPMHVGYAFILYGVAMAGVHQGWMLGPVSLAPSPEKVSQYVAIHATLVGIRGVLFQGLGMLVYKLTGDFTVSFLIAAAAFAAGSWQMWRLYGKTTIASRAATERDREAAQTVAPQVSTRTTLEREDVTAAGGS